MPANHDQKDIINPIVNTPKRVISPVYYMDESINTKDRFIITRLTDNGAYVRGNLIFYSLNGVEIYAELTDAIYVDLVNKTATVRKYSKGEEASDPKEDPELRQYIILFVPRAYEDEIDNDSECKWMAITGRQNTYNFIKDNIPSMDIDPKRSLILTNNVKFKDSFTISQFVDYIKNANLMPEDDFDIHWFEDEEDEEE